MHFKTTYRKLLFCKRIYCCYLEMPFYAVIFRASKSALIVDNWDAACEMRGPSPNSYVKKFATKTEAEIYIKDFNLKIVQNAKSPKGVKRKLIKHPNSSIISSAKDFTQKVNKAFNDLQVSVASFTGLSDTCVSQLKDLNCEVISNLHKILNINETESNGDVSLSVAISNQFSNGTGTLVFSNHKDLSSTCSTKNLDVTDSINLAPSELEAAKKSFTLNEKNEVIVYTDGACSNNGFRGASAGAGVWFGSSHPLNLAIKVPGVQTNNNAEIFSIIKAIERVKATGLTKVSIYTDSDFVIKSINEWMPRWQANGWKTSAGSEVKNKEMLMILHHQIKSLDSVSWTHVSGHSGVFGNEEADKLARLGAKCS